MQKDRRPPKAERDRLRRDQIVDAARACVVRRGFHAASMNEIATQARMSVGQIYRYFRSKDAIIHAIVDDLVAREIALMEQPDDLPRITTLLAQRAIDRRLGEGGRILRLEIAAEATRNPKVAALLADADRRLHAAGRRAVLNEHPHLTPVEAAVRVEILAVIYEGTMLRAGFDPVSSRAAYASMLRATIERLMAVPLEP